MRPWVWIVVAAGLLLVPGCGKRSVCDPAGLEQGLAEPGVPDLVAICRVPDEIVALLSSLELEGGAAEDRAVRAAEQAEAIEAAARYFDHGCTAGVELFAELASLEHDDRAAVLAARCELQQGGLGNVEELAAVDGTRLIVAIIVYGWLDGHELAQAAAMARRVAGLD